MAMIHPTAIIDPEAKIGVGVRIGPYCVVQAGVELGDDCKLHSHVVIDGPCTIGRGNEFFPFVSIGHRTQDLKYTGEPTGLIIGDGNVFRESVTLHRSTVVGGATRVGSHGNFLAYSHVAHDCVVGDHVIFSNNGTIAGHVVVEDHAIISGLTAVHQYCRIGRFAITGGCSKIVQDIPPFMIADGNPAEARGINNVGMERHGFAAEQVQHVKQAYKILYRSQLNTTQALERLKNDLTHSEEAKQIVEFIENSQRGIIR